MPPVGSWNFFPAERVLPSAPIYYAKRLEFTSLLGNNMHDDTTACRNP